MKVLKYRIRFDFSSVASEGQGGGGMLRRRALAVLSGAVASLPLLSIPVRSQGDRRALDCKLPEGGLSTAPARTRFSGGIRGAPNSLVQRFRLVLEVGPGRGGNEHPTHLIDARYGIRNDGSIFLQDADIRLNTAHPGLRPIRDRLPFRGMEANGVWIPFSGYLVSSRVPEGLRAWRAFIEQGVSATYWHRDPSRQIPDGLLLGRNREGDAAFSLRNTANMHRVLEEAKSRMAALRETHRRLWETNRNWTPGTLVGEGCEVSEEPCFLTTACVQTVGLSDDCFELQSLRRFRDRVLTASSDGRAMIETYYAIAPGLVERISLRQDARQVWEATYLRFILPCALLATTGLNRAALAHYRRMINYLTRLAESSCIGTLEPRIPAQSSASYPEPRDGPG